jgi:alkanesulfonate monooxygenase SsuD/methylene tetrahydromethanopterin reductase-like flavin-dependent oxidoreductase (luciferase family)
MKIGLFSNGTRHNSVAKFSYADDLYEIVAADRLGMTEAWISEHGTFLNHQAPDQLPSADLLICKAAALTKQIRMGPGIRPLPFFHPLQVATEAAVCDHLTDGRYMAGFGVGVNVARNNQRGPIPGDPRAMMREAVELIRKAWSAPEPFDWQGQFWQGKGWHIIPKPLTDIQVGIACTRSDSTIELTAEKGFLPLMAWHTTADQVRAMIDTYLKSEHKEGSAPSRERIRIGRVVYVADSVEQAKRDLHGGDLHHAAPRLMHLLPPGSDADALTFERLIDSGFFFCGDADTVYERIKSFYDAVGGFGTLLIIVGKDWVTPQQSARSLERFMAEVAPRLANTCLERFMAEVAPRLADTCSVERVMQPA